MAKIIYKLVVMFVLTLVFSVGVCSADGMFDNGNGVLCALMVFTPLFLAILGCGTGWFDDVYDWMHKMEDKVFC